MRIDTTSPERGWPPFLDWLATEGLDPHSVRAIELDEATLAGEAEVFALRNGKRFVRHGKVATVRRAVRFSSLPPRRLAA